MIFWKTPASCLLALAMFVGLSGCTADDSNNESSPSESSPVASPCEGLIGYESVPADLSDGDTVELVSTGIPVERPPTGGITREPDGTLTPSMEDEAFLLVGLPRPEGAEVPDDLVSSVTVTTFGVAEGTSDTPVNCSEDVEASVTFVSSEYLPIWEVKFDSPPYVVSLAEIDAPGVDRMLNFRTDSPLKFAYPDDGNLESKPQFVAERVYQEYFDSK